jgi:hypothetical protein
MAQTLGGKATNANEPNDGSPIKEVTTTKVGNKTSLDVNSIFANEFNTNDIEEVSAIVTYIGMEDKNGCWYVKKIDTSSDVNFSHAMETNNPTVTSYTDAWVNRATLTYNNYGDVF